MKGMKVSDFFKLYDFENSHGCNISIYAYEREEDMEWMRTIDSETINVNDSEGTREVIEQFGNMTVVRFAMHYGTLNVYVVEEA